MPVIISRGTEHGLRNLCRTIIQKFNRHQRNRIFLRFCLLTEIVNLLNTILSMDVALVSCL